MLAKVLVFEVPKAGCKVFWDLHDFQQAAWVSPESSWVTRGIKRWVPFFDKVGANICKEHVMARELMQEGRRYSRFATASATPVRIFLLLQ